VTSGWLHFDYIHLAWAVAALVGLLIWLEMRARGALGNFLSPVMQRRLTAQASPERTYTRLTLMAGALALCMVALMQPRAKGDGEVTSTLASSADVVFALDVSRSMLADDAKPNRLGRAKSEIGHLADQLAGSRLGLIAFAGRPAWVCPLTPDRDFFDSVLATVDTGSAGRGGTNLGKAIEAAIKGFPEGRGTKVLVLITDGDDLGGYLEVAGEHAHAAGVHIVAIGLGSPTGSEIVINGKPVMHDGKPVISKLDAEALTKLAQTTDGIYVPAGVNAIDYESIVTEHIKPLLVQGHATHYSPIERFTWPVLGALACLLAALWVGYGAGDRRMR
jgi:Ca-activated chloride channel family protein